MQSVDKFGIVKHNRYEVEVKNVEKGTEFTVKRITPSNNLFKLEVKYLPLKAFIKGLVDNYNQLYINNKNQEYKIINQQSLIDSQQKEINNLRASLDGYLNNFHKALEKRGNK